MFPTNANKAPTMNMACTKNLLFTALAYKTNFRRTHETRNDTLI